MNTGLHVAGHFGEWMQGRLGIRGDVVVITLPCPELGVAVSHRSARSGLVLQGMGAPAARVRLFLAKLKLRLNGRVRVLSSVPPGLGCGMSTASLVALARLAGWEGPPEKLGSACVQAEGASDPLMFADPETVLWASRTGKVLGRLPSLPRYEIVGGFWGAPQPTDWRDCMFSDISDLIPRWQSAASLAEFAALASESAVRCNTLRGPSSDPTPDLVTELGALGWVRANTGAARGLIFAPGEVPQNAKALMRASDLHGVIRFAGGGQ